MTGATGQAGGTGFTGPEGRRGVDGASALGFQSAFRMGIEGIKEKEEHMKDYSNKQTLVTYMIGGWMTVITVAAIIVLLVVYKRFHPRGAPSATRPPTPDTPPAVAAWVADAEKGRQQQELDCRVDVPDVHRPGCATTC